MLGNLHNPQRLHHSSLPFSILSFKLLWILKLIHSLLFLLFFSKGNRFSKLTLQLQFSLKLLLPEIPKTVLVVALSRKYGKRLASYTLAMPCLTNDYFFASTSFLSSSFPMYAISLASGLFLLDKHAAAVVVSAIDKFGPAMTLVKSDIGGNITRLETLYSSNPSRFNILYSLVQVEIESKTAKSSSSCTNGLLWLTRAMDFLVALFQNLIEHKDWPMSQACTDAYNKTLKKWHGWLASSSFTVVMKLAPDRKKFIEVIGGTGDINADIEKFCTTFSPLLLENHKFLVRSSHFWSYL
ncbi:Glycolipid transfer protein 1 [Lathyrus oleraceus]|uniref:Glycolipid transfer protein 1 n=1 Tax=Pisum sativum TaxID=3888 RepID=A0A9D5BJM6_PEA|nr:Glycolipid transfer protein 1 [Pisum sativum]